jgi:ribosomal protein S18 acetylase RimI-like enzyme
MSAIANEMHAPHMPRGKRSIFARGLRKLQQILRGAWRRIAQSKNHVFVRHRGGTMPPLPAGLAIHRFDQERDIPPRWLEFIRARKGEGYLQIMRQEFAEHGVLWLAIMDEQVAAYQWSRLGRYTPRWFVAVADNDVLIFATVTMEGFRGRGIGPAMMCHIINSETALCGEAYVDCAVWNRPAIRFIEKAGFHRIATLTPLPPRSGN